MTVVNILASRSHYHDHLLPIWEALPAEHRGARCAPRDAVWAPDGRPGPDLPGTWMVASYSDARSLGPRATIYVNHGAGQRYDGDERSKAHGAFVGGVGLDSIRLFLDPRRECSDAWTARYPQAVGVAVGCPKMDRWHAAMSETQRRSVGEPTIAVTFHHRGGLCPETAWAWPHYRHALGPCVAAWRAAGYRVVGHGHPLAEPALRRLWASLDVPWVTADEMFDQATVLVGDNTSLIPEFASTGRPVAWLNAPWYRRDVWHGGRFWAWPLGQVQIDGPDDLADGVLESAADRPRYRDARARMVASIYGPCDGHAAERAAAAILGLDIPLGGAIMGP